MSYYRGGWFRILLLEKIGKETIYIDCMIPFDVPASWMWVRLKHIDEVIGGGTPKTNNAAYWDGDIPWITPADLSGYNEIYLSCGERFITECGLAESSAKLLPAGAVLYSSRAPIGSVAIAENPVATNQGFKSVSPYYSGMSLYLYYCLSARTDDIVLLAPGTTFKEISGSEMAETLVPLPPLSEQGQIAEMIQSLLEKIDQIGDSFK